ncbi:MAG: hypothetical protein HY928_13885 [Elusimicrobia bacterium]|nr:hypothetical protein [Elusimicrobiota bacterium]
MSLLQAILARVAAARRAGRRPLVLLDLDDTLLDTTPRHLRIMSEFAALRPEAAALSGVGPAAVRYRVTETARAAGLVEEGLLSELSSFWGERFFKNDYLLLDTEVPGASAFSRAVVSAGGVPVYFTGRDEAMREGTLKSLLRHGFPAPDGGGDAPRLVLKPRFEMPDLAYKAEGLEGIAAEGSIEAGFENEPAHVNLFAERFPEAAMVFVDTKHSGKPVPVKRGVPSIRDFRA